MKSRRMPLVWMISLALHACFAVVVGYMAISSKQLKAQDTIDLSFFIVTPPQAAKRDVIQKPVVVTTPVPDLRVVPQTETTQRRTTVARAVRSSATAAPAASLMASAPAAPRGQQIKVPSGVSGDSTYSPNRCQRMQNYRQHQMGCPPQACPVAGQLQMA